MARPPGSGARRPALAKKVEPHERGAQAARDACRGPEGADGANGMEAALLTRIRPGRDDLFTGER
jgi:hypothetical protein